MPSRLRVLLAAICALAGVMIMVTGIAALGGVIWQQDGVPVNTATDQCNNPKLASDGAGGAIVTWQDGRDYTGTNNNIYVQRVRSNGTMAWTANGVGLCTATDNQEDPQIISDGAGGAIIAWEDYRSGANDDVYAQRVSADGTAAWATDGVTVSAAHNSQYDPQIASDGSGGAIVTWVDSRSGANNIYAQRMTSDGIADWTSDGVSLCMAVDSQIHPQIATDRDGGAIVTWEDLRPTTTSHDIYAQRVYSTGTVAWITDGVTICAAASYQSGAQIISDGAGGAIAVWSDRRFGSGNNDIYAQRVYSDGTTAWTDDGEIVCGATNDQRNPEITGDGAGGAIVVWEDRRNTGTTEWDIYAQRVYSDGSMAWASDGVTVCTDQFYQYDPQVVEDGRGGAIVTWRTESSGATSWDIYAQRTDPDGNALWQAGGMPVCVDGSDQWDPDIVGDGVAGAIITWKDERSLTQAIVGYIYAQRVGTVGVYVPVVLKSY